MIQMNAESIIKQVVEEVNRKYEQEALDEAEQRGIEKNKRDTAKKLKGILAPEEISRITGLSLKTIFLL